MKRPLANTAKPFSTPYWLLILSYSFLYVRWQDIIPGIGATRIVGILGYGLLIWFLVKGDRTVITREPLLKYAFIFLGLMAVSVLWAAHTSVIYTTQYVALLLLSYSAPLVFLLRGDWQRTVVFFRYWVLIQLLVALWALRMHGVGGGDFLADENDLSLAMCMALPYPLYLMSMNGCPAGWRLVCYLAVVAIIAVIMVSFSRGGFVGMVAVTAVMWVFSKKKGRNLGIALAVVVFGGGLISQMIPASYRNRLDSMFDPQNSTRVERLRSWEIARIMWAHNPILGVGAAQFPWNAKNYERMTSYWIDADHTKSLDGRQVHSLYFSLLPDMGLVGCTVWLIMVLALVRYMIVVIRTSDKLARGPPPGLKKAKAPPPTVAPEERARIDDCALLAKAILCSLAGFLVSGAFISVAYYPHIWLLVGFATVVKIHGALRDPAQETVAALQPRKRSYIARPGLRARG